MSDVAHLYQLIKRWRLDWRHPQELARVVRKIEKGRLSSAQARRWLRRIRPWVEQQELCFNPFGPAPDQETLSEFMVGLGELVERPGTRVGIRRHPRHILISGETGAGKSTVLRRIIDGIDSGNRAARGLHRNPGSGL